MLACQYFNGMKEGVVFRLNDELVLYIGYAFMLHPVTFALSKLFVSFGDVALGIVLRLLKHERGSTGTTLEVDMSESYVLIAPENIEV